jgi:hypothetical protein
MLIFGVHPPVVRKKYHPFCDVKQNIKGEFAWRQEISLIMRGVFCDMSHFSMSPRVPSRRKSYSISMEFQFFVVIGPHVVGCQKSERRRRRDEPTTRSSVDVEISEVRCQL